MTRLLQRHASGTSHVGATSFLYDNTEGIVHLLMFLFSFFSSLFFLLTVTQKSIFLHHLKGFLIP